MLLYYYYYHYSHCYRKVGADYADTPLAIPADRVARLGVLAHTDIPALGGCHRGRPHGQAD